MGSIGKVAKISASKLSNYDKKFSDSIGKAGKALHSKYPAVEEIMSIMPQSKSDMGATLASMNGLGILDIREDLLQNFDATEKLLKSRHDAGYLAGKGTFEDFIYHELSHNLDQQFSSFMMSRIPSTGYEMNYALNQKWADALSETLGRKVNVGDTVKVPGLDSKDYDDKLLDIGGHKFSYHDIQGTALSHKLVPIAIKNVQDNWKAFGFKYQPSEPQLINQLSGYAMGYYNPNSDNDKSNYYDEIFAEAHSNHKSYGANANVLAQEIVRLTDGAYKSLASRPVNEMTKYYKKFFKVTDSLKKKNQNGGAV